MNVTNSGSVFHNGTWSNALGLVQSGFVDMWATDASMTPVRFDSFLYTTPFTIEKYGALMKRQTDTFHIDTLTLTAGVDVHIYGILLAIFMSLFVLSYVNERCHKSTERNGSWCILLSLMPLNGAMWSRQTGVTRKILMATIGFATLILSSLYLAKHSEELMIPYPPPEVTLGDIEYLISTGRAKLVFNYNNSNILTKVKNESEILARALIKNPPIFNANFLEYISLMDTQNVIAIDGESMILDYLSSVDPKHCSNYVFVTFESWTRLYGALIMRKERVDVLEAMNIVVAERMSYVDNYVRSYELEQECRKRIFPVFTPDPKYEPLVLMNFSGAFALLIILLGVSGGVLLLEMIVFRFEKSNLTKEQIVKSFEIQYLLIDETTEESKRERIYAKYLELLHVIDTD